MKFTLEQKAQVARYTLELGNKRSIVRYSKRGGVNLKESTARAWKMKYTGLRKRKPTESLPIKALPGRKQRSPLLLGGDLDTEKDYVKSIRKLGNIVNSGLILGGAEAITADRDRTLLDMLAPREEWAVAFVQDGLSEEEGHNKGQSCSRGI